MILFTYCLIIGVNGFPTGAPAEACGDVTDIMPNHRPYVASNNDDIPYYVHSYDFEYNNDAYTPGGYYYCKC